MARVFVLKAVIHMKRNVQVKDLGCLSYRQGYEIQQQCLKNAREEGVQTLLLCEHPPTITLGRLADEKNLLFSEGYYKKNHVDVLNIDRGGDVTLHAPGQLVIYPILDLIPIGKDLHAYLHKLEEVGIDLLSQFDILASRLDGKTGVWVSEKKIISCGIGVKKWVTYHGMAVNVNTDLSYFKLIRPCGLDVSMTSIVKCCRCELEIEIAQVKEKVIDCFSRVFQLEFLSGRN